MSAPGPGRLAGHICPDCGAALPWFALHATFRGGLKRARLAPCLDCPGCPARVVLAPRPDGPGMVLWQIVLPLGMGLGFLLLASLAMSFVPPHGGLIPAAAVLFSFTACFGLAFALIRARLERVFLQVEVL